MTRVRILVWCWCVGLPVQAFADTTAANKYFNSAIVQYELLNYEQALRQLEKAAAKATSPEQDKRIALLAGIVNVELGKTNNALAAFSSAFGIDAEATLPIDVAPKIAAFAENARRKVKGVVGQSRGVMQYWPVSPKVCYDADAAAAQLWEPAERKLMLERIEKSEVKEVAARASELVGRFDDWVQRWADQKLATCLRDKVRHELSTAAVNGRERCLHDGATTFKFLVKTLAEDATLGSGTLRVTERLPEPAECMQDPVAQRKDKGVSPLAAEAREFLAQAKAFYDLGRHKKARDFLSQAEASGAQSKDLEFKADMLNLSAELKIAANDTPGAIADCQAVVAQALEIGNRVLAIRALSKLILLHGDHQHDLEAARLAYRWAQSLLARGDDILLSVFVRNRWGWALWIADKWNQAGKEWELNLKLLERVESTRRSEWARISTLHYLEAFAIQKNDNQRGLEINLKSSALVSRLVGAESLEFARNDVMKAILLLNLGRLDEAEKTLLSVLELSKKYNWANERADASRVMGEVALVDGRFQLAQTRFEECLHYFEQKRGPDHPFLIDPLTGLALALRRNGHAEQAVSVNRRALALADQHKDAKRRAIAMVQLGADYASLQHWHELPAITQECSAASRRNELELENRLQCEMLVAEQMWQAGRTREALKTVHHVLTPRSEEKKILPTKARELQWIRSEAQRWLGSHTQPE